LRNYATQISMTRYNFMWVTLHSKFTLDPL